MDLIKIGKYIAGKRKALGLTQSQLAEKLGKSDKSVSKWERGICLPDVSVYLELCGILGISINEFLAGEDISAENIKAKADNNLIQVTQDSSHKQKSLKGIIAALAVLALVITAVLGAVIYRGLNRPHDYITALDPDSVEMKTAELLSGVDGAFLFKYDAAQEIRGWTLYVTEYRRGELIAKEEAAAFVYDETGTAPEGTIALVPDFEECRIRLIIANNAVKYSAAIPLLEEAEDRNYFGRTATGMEGTVPIRYGSEQGLVAFIYGRDRMRVTSLQQLETGDVATENEYVYYFSLKFDG